MTSGDGLTISDMPVSCQPPAAAEAPGHTALEKAVCAQQQQPLAASAAVGGLAQELMLRLIASQHLARQAAVPKPVPMPVPAIHPPATLQQPAAPLNPAVLTSIYAQLLSSGGPGAAPAIAVTERAATLGLGMKAEPEADKVIS